MARIDRAQEKWQRNTAQAAGAWKAGVQRAGAQEFCQGIADFIGDGGIMGPCQQDEGAEWQRQVNATPESDFREGVENAAARGRWRENYVRRFRQG